MHDVHEPGGEVVEDFFVDVVLQLVSDVADEQLLGFGSLQALDVDFSLGLCGLLELLELPQRRVPLSAAR